MQGASYGWESNKKLLQHCTVAHGCCCPGLCVLGCSMGCLVLPWIHWVMESNKKSKRKWRRQAAEIGYVHFLQCEAALPAHVWVQELLLPAWERDGHSTLMPPSQPCVLPMLDVYHCNPMLMTCSIPMSPTYNIPVSPACSIPTSPTFSIHMSLTLCPPFPTHTIPVSPTYRIPMTPTRSVPPSPTCSVLSLSPTAAGSQEYPSTSSSTQSSRDEVNYGMAEEQILRSRRSGRRELCALLCHRQKYTFPLINK